MEPFDFYDFSHNFQEQLPYQIDFNLYSDDNFENNYGNFDDCRPDKSPQNYKVDTKDDKFQPYTVSPNFEVETKGDGIHPDKSLSNNLQYIHHSSFLERIKNELGITKYEYDAFINVLKDKLKDKKATFERTVTTHHKSGTIKRSITCCRRFISLSDEARIFQIAFFHFTYGSLFQKKFVKILHDNICGILQIKPINRDQFRSIRLYFEMFLSSGFEITFQARKYCIEHPEFIAQITESKKKNLI